MLYDAARLRCGAVKMLRARRRRRGAMPPPYVAAMLLRAVAVITRALPYALVIAHAPR